MTWDLRLADNLSVLVELDDASVDLVYVDPPFGTGAARGRGSLRFEDPGDMAGYLAWLRPRLAGFHRVLRSTGSLFVHVDWRSVHHVRLALDEIFGPARFVNEIVWCYSVGGKSRRAFGRKHDTILWYGRTDRYHFYPDAVRVPRRGGSHMRVESDADGAQVQVKRDRRTGRVYRYPVALGKVPEDYWTDIETLNRGARERTGWPTQKPAALLRRIVLATTQPGDLVADFFCGSGTTLAVAVETGRRALGVDTSPAAIAIARARLEAALGTAPAAPVAPAVRR